MSGGYGRGGYPPQGYGAPDYDGDPGPDGPRWQGGGQQQGDGVWGGDQGYDAPGYGPAGYGGQDFGAPGDDGRAYGEQTHEDQRYSDQRYGNPGYGDPGHDGRGYGQPDGRTGPPYPPQGPATGGQRYPRNGSQPSYPGQPGQPDHPGQQGTGPRRGTNGYDQRGYDQSPQRGQGGWAQDQGDSSFLPGFGRRDEFDGGHVGGRAPERDGRYDYDDYDDRRAPRAGWPAGPAGPADRGPGDRGPDPRGRNDRDDRNDRNRRPRRRGVTRWAPRILVLTVVLVIVIGGLVGGLNIYHKYEARYHPADYVGPGTGDVTVQVMSGDTAFSLAPRLLQLGVIASDRAFTNAVENSTAVTSTGGLEAGFYVLHHHMQASLAYAALLNPKNLVQTTVTIPEGKRAVDVIAIIAKKTKIPLKNFKQVLAHPKELGLPPYADGKVEGYLFPATYAIIPHETALQILQAMVQRFDVEATQINIATAAKSVGLTPTQLIIEASLAQAEGGSVADYPKIAEVIHNRLANGMHLQFDSTVLYGLGKYAVSATDAELAINTPYNTYLHAGLPAGPISNPGDSAIEGILHADHGNWLYFLTVPGGKSQFSATCLKGQC